MDKLKETNEKLAYKKYLKSILLQIDLFEIQILYLKIINFSLVTNKNNKIRNPDWSKTSH